MVRRVHKYANGGPVEKKAPPPPPPKSSDLGSGMAKKAGDILANRRKKQMEDLGLRNGGKVKRKC